MKKTYHSRQLEGILCVDKPQDWTSFDVVAKMRGIADCHKIGHGGTLDPMATGVLPLFFGRSAKAMELMPVQDKRYTASIRFGVLAGILRRGPDRRDAGDAGHAGPNRRDR